MTAESKSLAINFNFCHYVVDEFAQSDRVNESKYLTLKLIQCKKCVKESFQWVVQRSGIELRGCVISCCKCSAVEPVLFFAGTHLNCMVWLVVCKKDKASPHAKYLQLINLTGSLSKALGVCNCKSIKMVAVAWDSITNKDFKDY